MNKTLIFLSCLLVLTLSQDSLQDSPILIGGYSVLAKNDLNETPELGEIEQFARSEFATQNNG